MAKDHPISTKKGKEAFIKNLSASMLKSFLEKSDRLPEDWNGIEIRTWMAESWARESNAPQYLKANTKRGRDFRSAKYNNNL